jgi:hypothetical protein
MKSYSKVERLQYTKKMSYAPVAITTDPVIDFCGIGCRYLDLHVIGEESSKNRILQVQIAQGDTFDEFFNRIEKSGGGGGGDGGEGKKLKHFFFNGRDFCNPKYFGSKIYKENDDGIDYYRAFYYDAEALFVKF